MKQRMERFVALPFSTGCYSPASVAVGRICPKKPKSESSPNVRGEEYESKTRTKNSPFGRLPLPKPNISSGIHKLIKCTVRSFSQLFVYKDIEDVTSEMEIGFPTDVKHVTHIGLDGTATTNHVKGWEDFNSPEIIAFPSISLRQFELAMAAQTQNAPFIV